MDLHPGEEIVFDGHPSWRAVLVFYVTGIALVAVAAAIAALVSGAVLAVPVGAVGLALVVLVGLVKRKATRYVITSERLHIRHGILSKRTQETRIQRVQNVNTEQSFFARIMRVGTVDFDTAGTDDSEFSSSASRIPRRSSAPSTARSGRRRPRRGLRSRRPTRSSAAPRSDQPVADLVLDALALGGEDGDRLAGALGGGDLAVQAVLVELEALDLERGRVGGKVARADHQLGDEVRQFVGVGRQ